jgi:hypothetical protein
VEPPIVGPIQAANFGSLIPAESRRLPRRYVTHDITEPLATTCCDKLLAGAISRQTLRTIEALLPCFPGLYSSVKPSTSLPNKACNVHRGRISIIGGNAREVNLITVPSAPSHSSGYASFAPAGRPTSLTMNPSTFTPLKNGILLFLDLTDHLRRWRGPCAVKGRPDPVGGRNLPGKSCSTRKREGLTTNIRGFGTELIENEVVLPPPGISREPV